MSSDENASTWRSCTVMAPQRRPALRIGTSSSERVSRVDVGGAIGRLGGHVADVDGARLGQRTADQAGVGPRRPAVPAPWAAGLALGSHLQHAVGAAADDRADGVAELSELLDGDAEDLLRLGAPSKARPERAGQLDPAGDLGEPVGVSSRGRAGRDRRAHEKAKLELGLHERRRGVVGVELDEKGPVGSARRCAQHRLVPFGRQQVALGAIGARVAEIDGEGAAAVTHHPGRGREAPEGVDLFLQPHAQAHQPRVAVVGGAHRADHGGARLGERDRPGRGVDGLGQRGGDRLEAIERGAADQLALEQLGCRDGRLADPLARAAPEQPPAAAECRCRLAGLRGAELAAAAALGHVLGRVSRPQQLLGSPRRGGRGGRSAGEGDAELAVPVERPQGGRG